MRILGIILLVTVGDVGTRCGAGDFPFRYGVLKKGADRSGSAASLGIPEEGELKEIFRNLRILRYQEVEEISDWQVGNS
jgi:hypothetical protein